MDVSPGSEVELRNIMGFMVALALCPATGCSDSDDSARPDALTQGVDATTLDAPDLVIDGAASDATPFVCDLNNPQQPPGSVLWPNALSATGADTLNGHGHDDSLGAVGFCPGSPVPGQPFYRLIAAGFETDEDINGINGNSDALAVDFWRDSSEFTGIGESAGRVNIYVDIVDATNTVLNVVSSPEIRLVRTIYQGPEEVLPLTSKPANEFQTNMPMTGGGSRYSVSVQGASDRVVNMRLPVNHHVTFILIFRRVAE